MSGNMKIGVVLVTRNRLECLKIALQKYESQIKKPEFIVVVNNCSTDGITKDFLNTWEKTPSDYQKIVVHSKDNGGGSGGFFLAEQEAMKLEADWIWHADDDAYPDEYALKAIEDAYTNINSGVAAYCASIRNITNPDEDISCWRKLYRGIFFVKWFPAKKKDKYFDVDKFMYLGCVIKKEVLKKVGLTNKEFFIHEDDIEHSLRVRKAGRIIAVTDSYLFHPAWNDIQNPNLINWKFYYSVRNKIVSIGINFGKKYWYSEVVKAELKHIVHKAKGYPAHVLKMERDAIYDGKHKNLGKNKHYLP